MKHLVLAASLALTLASCRSPLSKVYSATTAGEDLHALVESGKLDSAQGQLLASYVRQAQLRHELLQGATYQQLLARATARQAQAAKEAARQQALAAKAAAEEAARLEQLRAVAAVTVFHKGFIDSKVQAGKYGNYITFDVAIHNQSPKDIRAITGMLIFHDVFEQPLKEVLVTNDSGVKAGKTLKYGSGIDYNDLIDGDQLLRYKSLDKLKISWQPEQVLFADGTSLAASKMK